MSVLLVSYAVGKFLPILLLGQVYCEQQAERDCLVVAHLNYNLHIDIPFQFETLSIFRCNQYFL